MLVTFTSTTTPTADQAQGFIDNAVSEVLNNAGPLPPSPPTSTEVAAQYRTAAALRAAADIELAYPNRTADINVALALDARAKTALATLLANLKQIGYGQVDAVPYWAFPDPGSVTPVVISNPYGDWDI